MQTMQSTVLLLSIIVLLLFSLTRTEVKRRHLMIILVFDRDIKFGNSNIAKTR